MVAYDGLNKAKTKQEQEGTKGCASSFQGLMQFIMSLLPQSEVIEQALRKKRTGYPDVARREIVAHALIHQDFSITAAGSLIEIYDDRIEFSNPGGLLPFKRLDRLIGTQPESRNEQLARAFRRQDLRGARFRAAEGWPADRALRLAANGVRGWANHFKVTLYSPRTFADLSAKERVEACYQHAVLKCYSGSAMTNTSLRERLKMPEQQRSMVSVLIQQATDQQLVKPAAPENKSKKFAEYVPFWA